MSHQDPSCCHHAESAASDCCRNDSACCSSGSSACDLGGIYAMLLLRGWLAVRAIQTGIEKYAGTQSANQLVPIDGAANAYGLTSAASVKSYGLNHYQGIPEELLAKFQAEPLMLKAALPYFDKMLGPALIVLGMTILIGFATRTSLFLLGLLYTSLTWGLILLKRDDGVSWLGIHMVLIALALALAKHDRLALLRKW